METWNEHVNDTLESFSNIADDVSAAAVHGHDGLHHSVAQLGHDGVQQQAAVRVAGLIWVVWRNQAPPMRDKLGVTWHQLSQSESRTRSRPGPRDHRFVLHHYDSCCLVTLPGCWQLTAGVAGAGRLSCTGPVSHLTSTRVSGRQQWCEDTHSHDNTQISHKQSKPATRGTLRRAVDQVLLLGINPVNLTVK